MVCVFLIAKCLMLETKRELRNTLLRILLRFILPMENNLLIFLFIIFVLVAVNQLVRFTEELLFTIIVVSERISCFLSSYCERYTQFHYLLIKPIDIQRFLNTGYKLYSIFMTLTTFMYI